MIDNGHTGAALRAALDYHGRGWAPIPIPFRTKAPKIDGWQTLRLPREELPERFGGRCNVGVLLGDPSHGTIDVDLDHPLAVELASRFLPPTGAVFGRPGKPCSHFLYRLTRAAATKKYQFPRATAGALKRDTDGAMIVEFRSSGCQTVFPGSVHESGEPIEWAAAGEPADVDPDDLLAAIEALANEVRSRCGYLPTEPAMPRSNGQNATTSRSAFDRCLAYHDKMPDAISGRGGHGATLAAACECYRFALSDDQAMSAMQRFNATKTGGEPWTDRELAHKLRDALAKVEAASEFGCRMNDRRHARNGSAPRQPSAKAGGKKDPAANLQQGTAITNAEVIEAADPESGEPKRTVAPLPIADVLLRIRTSTDNWPRRIGSALFTHDESGLAWLTNEAALFGWLGSRTGIIQWYRALGCPSKGEVFAELQRTVERYDAIEELPHQPPIGRHYYACSTPAPGDGSALRGLLGRFTPATPIDGDLMLAALLTIFWGGSCGSRPAFVFTADAGRGKGKSKAAELLSRVAGGTIDFSANEDMGQIKTRLLSPDALPKRVALLDNVKSHRFSWAELEALITAPAISGRRMYVGEGTRPNTLTWIVTLNGAALSTDMAQRSIIVKIGEPNRSRSWEDETTAYIEANRQAIIADAIGILAGPPQAELARYSRWATWEAGVLSRLPDPSEAQSIILERQGAVDVEAEEADAIAEFFRGQLERLDYTTDREIVLIPSAVASRWLNWATGEQRSVIAGCRTIKQLCDERRLSRLAASAGRGNGRGFVWSGELADVEERMKTDVIERLAAKERQNG